jgi:RHS repeat-associated protein
LLGFGSNTYTYKYAGDLDTKTINGTATQTYKYDSLGNLRNVVFKTGSTTTKTIDYLVDGLGRRIGKKTGTTTTTLAQQFVYRSGLQIAAELTASGAVKTRFFYGSRANVPDFMEKVGSPSTYYRIVSDQLGSPVLIVNVANKNDVLLDVAYDEWGKLICRAQPNNAPDCAPDGSGSCNETKCEKVVPFGFAGGLYDEDTRLIRFGARDYDPEVGRWVSKDPILFAAGQGNLYVYVGNDPVNLRDASGLDVEVGDVLQALDAAQTVAASVAVGALVSAAVMVDLPGAAAGAVSGASSGLTSGGGAEAALRGALAGAIVGAANPFGVTAMGAGGRALLSNFLGQAGENLFNDPFKMVNFKRAAGGAAARALFTGIAGPTPGLLLAGVQGFVGGLGQGAAGTVDCP